MADAQRGGHVLLAPHISVFPMLVAAVPSAAAYARRLGLFATLRVAKYSYLFPEQC